MSSTKLTIILFSLIIIPAIACGGSSSQPDQKPTRAVVELATATPPPAADSVSEATATPVPPPTPTPVPEPVYQEPVVFLEYSAVGENVSDNFTLPACQKAVFSYSVQSSDIGYASLILKFNKVGDDRDVSLVNQMEETPQMVGQVLQPLTGGEYYFSSENTDEPWQVVLECHDNTAPVAEGIDLQGEGPTVSPNYHLPDCQKSVFVWESQPGGSGYASIIVHLFLTNQGELKYGSIANDMAEGALAGEKLQSVTDGDYFLTVENTNEPWSIRWECRD
jgi:hypothetical protein